jgi:AcrR family transcriptional regulator
MAAAKGGQVARSTRELALIEPAEVGEPSRNEVGLRRVPRQQRSWDRVDVIANAAARLFAAQPFDAVTTNAIADAAAIGVGSLYDFFADREAIAAHLAARYRHDCVELLRTEVAAADGIRAAAEGTADALVAYQRRNPAMAALLMVRGRSAALDALADGLRVELSQALRDVLVERKGGLVSPARLSQVSSVVVDLIGQLLARVADAPPRQRRVVQDEWCSVIVNYLEGDAFGDLYPPPAYRRRR